MQLAIEDKAVAEDWIHLMSSAALGTGVFLLHCRKSFCFFVDWPFGGEFDGQIDEFCWRENWMEMAKSFDDLMVQKVDIAEIVVNEIFVN